MRRRPVLLGGLAVAAAGLLVAALAPRDRAAAPSPRPAARRAPTAAAPAAPPRPPSIADVAEDGRLTAGSAGELVVDVELRRFLDHHLLATGEEPPEVTRARIEAALAARLPPRAAREARELLARYLALREASRRLTAAADEDLAVRLAALRALRREQLGEGAAPLSPAEAAAVAPLAALRAEVAADDVRALRVRAFGEAGAERLAALDESRAAWARRLEAFRAERARLDAEVGDADARRARLAGLLGRAFSPSERLRVEALERAAGRPLD